jgi:O-antigen ligase
MLKSKANINNYIICIYIFFISIWVTHPLVDGFMVVRLFDLVVFISFIFLIASFIKRGEISVISSNFYVLYFLYMILIVISFLWGSAVVSIVKELIQFIEILFFIVIMTKLGQKVTLDRMVSVFYLSSILVVFIFIIYNMLNMNFIGIKDSAIKILPGLVASMAFSFLLIDRKNKYFFIFFTMLLFTILTLERKSWIALLISIIVQILIYYRTFGFPLFKIRKSTVKYLFLLILIFIPMTLSLWNHPLISKQVDSLVSIVDSNQVEQETASNRERRDILISSYEIFEQSPFFGVGIGNFKEEYNIVSENARVSSPHNEFIRVIIEFGLIGFVLYVCLWLYAIRYIYRFNLYVKSKRIKERNHIFILSLITYGISILFFRAEGLINYLLLFIPIIFILVHKYENHLKVK